jgi:hypothetical protein
LLVKKKSILKPYASLYKNKKYRTLNTESSPVNKGFKINKKIKATREPLIANQEVNGSLNQGPLAANTGSETPNELSPFKGNNIYHTIERKSNHKDDVSNEDHNTPIVHPSNESDDDEYQYQDGMQPTQTNPTLTQIW